MERAPPKSTRTATPLPFTTLFLSLAREPQRSLGRPARGADGSAGDGVRRGRRRASRGRAQRAGLSEGTRPDGEAGRILRRSAPLSRRWMYGRWGRRAAAALSPLLLTACGTAPSGPEDRPAMLLVADADPKI